MIWSTITGFFHSPKKRGVASEEPRLAEDAKQHDPESGEPISAPVPVDPVTVPEASMLPDPVLEVNEPSESMGEEFEERAVVPEPQQDTAPVTSREKPLPRQMEPVPVQAPPAAVSSPPIVSEQEQIEAQWAAVRPMSRNPTYAERPPESQQPASEASPPSEALPPDEAFTNATRSIAQQEAAYASNSSSTRIEPEVPAPASTSNELAIAVGDSQLTPLSSDSGTSHRFSMLHSLANRWSHPLPKRELLIVVSTRAEARRLAPVVRTLHARFAMTGKREQICVCVIGGETASVKEACGLLGMPVECDVSIPSEGMTAEALRVRVLNSFEEMLAQVKPDWMVLAGDTLVSGMAALAAYYAGVQVARVEPNHHVQPNTSDPNDVYRQLVDLFSAVHFAETSSNKESLVKSGVPQDSVLVVGSTGIDSLFESCTRLGLPVGMPSSRSVGTTRVLVHVGHHLQRDSELREVARAIENLCLTVRGLYHFEWLLPPRQSTAHAIQNLLRIVPGMELLAYDGYEDFLRRLHACDIVLTDSTDTQEEAPSLGKPALMLGPISEHSEPVRAGVVVPVAPQTAYIQSAIRMLARKLSTRHGQITNPSGDGKASARIADFFEGRPVLEFGRRTMPRLTTTPDESTKQLPTQQTIRRLV